MPLLDDWTTDGCEVITLEACDRILDVSATAGPGYWTRRTIHKEYRGLTYDAACAGRDVLLESDWGEAVVTATVRRNGDSGEYFIDFSSVELEDWVAVS